MKINIGDLMALEMVLTIIIEDQLSTILNNCTKTIDKIWLDNVGWL